MTPQNPASEHLLRGNEPFMRAFMENCPTMTWCKDEEGRYVFLSPPYERHFGVTLADRLGKTDFDLWPKKIAEEYRKNDLAVLAAGNPIDFVESAINPDGSACHWLNNILAFRDASGRRYVGGIALNITEIKKLEDELEKFRFSFERLGDSVFWVNREGRILYANESAWKTRGYKREEILNISIFDLDPDYQEGVWIAHFEDLKKRGTITLETRHRTKDGRILPIEVNANYVCIGGQEFNFATVRDITERKRSEEALANENKRSHLLAVLGRELDEAETKKAAALSVLNAAGKVLDWDCGWLRIWNATTQEWREIVAFDLIDGVKQEVTFNGSSMSRLSNIVQQALERPQLLLRESEDDSTEILTVFGSGRRSLSLIFAPIRLGNQLIGMLSVQSYKHHAYDAAALELIQLLADHCAGTMARLRYQESLRQSEVRFKTFFESVPEAIFVLATGEDSGRIIDANPFAEEIHGYARGELRGLRIQDLDLPADANLVSERISRLGQGENLIFEVEHFRKDGSIFPLEVRASLINLGSQRLILAFNRDISERKKIDTALRASEKLAATGRMAAGIAHEINNPLNGIRASLHLVEKAVPANHPDFEFIKRIEREIDRIATITHRMFTLYKPTQDEAQEFSLKKLLEDVVYLSQPNAEKSGARLTYTAQVSECLVKLPEAAVSEVLYNLIKNAIEASPKGGEVTVKLSCVEGYALITIEDQGDGIPEELKDRVFEPFFTTKSGSGERGLGLGLATARSRVEAMRGHISFNPSKVQGTVFHVTLPIQLAIESR